MGPRFVSQEPAYTCPLAGDIYLGDDPKLIDKERLARFILSQDHGTSLRFPLSRTAGRRLFQYVADFRAYLFPSTRF